MLWAFETIDAPSLAAYTHEGAFAAHQEAVTGSLGTGKLADLSVWPDDPSQLTMTELAQLTTVDMIIVGGKVVYERA